MHIHKIWQLANDQATYVEEMTTEFSTFNCWRRAFSSSKIRCRSSSETFIVGVLLEMVLMAAANPTGLKKKIHMFNWYFPIMEKQRNHGVLKKNIWLQKWRHWIWSEMDAQPAGVFWPLCLWVITVTHTPNKQCYYRKKTTIKGR